MATQRAYTASVRCPLTVPTPLRRPHYVNHADLRVDRNLTCSPQRTAQVLKDNFLKVPPQTMTFVAYGWVAGLKGLPVGQHRFAQLRILGQNLTHARSDHRRCLTADAARLSLETTASSVIARAASSRG